MIYESGKIVLYCRVCVQRRPVRTKLGELELLSLAQARRQHLINRAMAARGEDPRRPRPPAILFGDLHHDHYVVQCESRGKKTISTDISRYENWLAPAFAKMPVDRITKTDIAHLIVKMREAGKAPSTIKSTVSQLGATLEIAVDLGIIDRSPVRGVRTPRINNRRTQFLTVSQMRDFMVAAKAEQNLIASRMLMLMALTGARLGECTKAKHADFDLVRGIWHLPDQKSGRPGQIVLSAAAKAIILEMAKARSNDYLFPGQRSKGMVGRPIRAFRRICQAANIPQEFRIHDLRHAWVSAGVNAGIPIEIMSQGARHADSIVTRRYSHMEQASLLAASETISALFAPSKATGSKKEN